MGSFRILATGSFCPDRVVSNAELEKYFATTDEWIRAKTGIANRRYAANGEGVSDLAVQAAKSALKQAGLNPADLDGIVFATNTAEYQAPGSGFLLQKKLGCRDIFAWDLRNTSTGFLAALELTDGLMALNRYKRLLVVASEVHSTALDFSDRGRLMSVIFGDGCGCFIVEKSDDDLGLVDCMLCGDGTYFDQLWCEKPSSLTPGRITETDLQEGRHYPQMNGRVVFEHAVSKMSEVIKNLLIKNKMSVGDVDWFVPHQANLRIIEAVGAELNFDAEQLIVNIQNVGNTSSASIPIAFDEAVQEGKIKRGQTVLVSTFGSGFSWGAGLIRF